ncbi:MAG: hypothetical protein L6Q78_10995 [Bacteroidia bacterium]|nr:hypothetical protein [Bacteroidia bacterium]
MSFKIKSEDYKGMENSENKKLLSRKQLKQLSEQLKPLKDSGEIETINEGLIRFCYTNEEHNDFKKFNEWKRLGFTIVKGSKGFPVWAQPVAAKKQEAQEKAAEEYEFFPICYLFSNAQVRRLKP